MPRFAAPKMIARARTLRRTMPVCEEKMWSELRAGRLMGLKFRRQVPIGGFVADFACHDHRLVVEIDGPSHFEGDAASHDRKRTLAMERAGWRVIRFTNEDVLTARDAVCSAILWHVGIR